MIIAGPQPHPAGKPLRMHVSVQGWTPPSEGCNISSVTHPTWRFTWQVTPAGPGPSPGRTKFHSAGGIAVLPAVELVAPAYMVRVVATPRVGPAHHLETALTVAVQLPPAYSGAGAGPLQVAAVPGGVRLSTNPTHWPADLRYRFMLQSPEGLLLPIPDAPNFTASPAVTVPLPWLPAVSLSPVGAVPGPYSYTFALVVRDAQGTEAGPFLAPAPAPTPAAAPNCVAICAAAAELLQEVACGTCSAAGYRPDADVERRLRTLPATAALDQRRDLLHAVALVALRFRGTSGAAPPALSAGAAAAAAPLLLNATAPLLGSDSDAAVLLRALDALLYGSPATTVGLLMDMLRTARRERDGCGDPGFHFGPPGAGPCAAVRRVERAALPVVVQVGGAFVHLPPSVWAAVGAAEADVHATITRGTGALVTDVVTVTLHDPVTGRGLAVRDLPEPITIEFATNASALLHPPDWYRCVSGAPGDWASDGTWLTSTGAGGLRCHTTHLTSFAVQAVPQIVAVSGCALDLPPGTLHCPAAPGALTVAGGHFGASGARVTVQGSSGAARECPTVRHEGPDQLVCADVRLPASGQGPEWYDVTVHTSGGLSASRARVLLSAGVPELSGLRALGLATGACAESGPGALTDCPRTGTAFGLEGHFVTSSDFGSPRVFVGSFECPSVIAVSATYLECRGLAGAGRALPVVVRLGRVVAAAQWRFTVAFRECEGKAGHWSGAECAKCQTGWYGAGCDQRCPGGGACSGHGICDDGPVGSGRCFCARGAATGYWSGRACDQCDAWYGGPGCVLRCPGVTRFGVCSGHGDCVGVGYDFDSISGSSDPSEGSCSCYGNATHGHWTGPECADCARGWVGRACTVACPGHAGLACGGHGVCSSGSSSPSSGADSSDDSSVADEVAWCVCDPEYAGRSCESHCPCSGHGRCIETAIGTGACACDPGFAGAACAAECPGGAWLPCNGHGRCDPGTGGCVCHRDETSGHWDGAACDVCAGGWSGAMCAVQCPRNASGVPCGPGLCLVGQCLCPPGTCGRACDIAGASCDAAACPTGFYGAGCARRCPRDTNDRLCGARGTCLARTYGTGECACDAGYTGATCSFQCPRTAAGVCGGHGVCVVEAGGCACFPGYGMRDCSKACPSHRGLLCAGHGTCDDGPNGRGTCECAAGYTNLSCGALCPGFDPLAPFPEACGGHGLCNAPQLHCDCLRTERTGYWAGETCGDCASGWYGGACDKPCVPGHGRTVGKVCLRLLVVEAEVEVDRGRPPNSSASLPRAAGGAGLAAGLWGEEGRQEPPRQERGSRSASGAQSTALMHGHGGGGGGWLVEKYVSFIQSGPVTGGAPGRDPTPKGGGGTPPSTDAKIVARNNVLCRRQRRRRFCFRHTAGGIFLVRPYVSILKILRISWRIQKWLKSTRKVM